MKKNSFNRWLMAALVCGLSLGVTSCKDDDKDDNGGNGSGQEVGATETDEAMAAYNWLTNMTDIGEFTDDWASKTYEPTIGVESTSQANTRIVVVADIDYAKMNFASISGLSIDQLSATQSQTIDGVGTITWTPSAEGASNLATVDVNTKLIPHLTKIVYCTAEQVGDNGGSFKGTAYYRFGDVIEDAEGYYWVCVKPAFGTGSAAQQQGYWINILNRDPTNGKSTNGKVPAIPEINICRDYDGQYNGNTILLPTKLNSTKEMTHNLANLVWALLYPIDYYNTVGDDGIGLGGYDYKYNGRKFCEHVAAKWTENKIWEKLFNRSYKEMKKFDKINFYYEGYHFTPKIHLGSSNLGCATVMGTESYANTYVTTYAADKKKNLEMKEKGAGFDLHRYCSDPDQNADCASSGKAGYAPAKQFSDTEGYWIVRQKTSSQIAGTWSHPSVYATLNNTAEIYRYNQAYRKIVGAESPVEEENELSSIAPYENRGFYNLGDVVKDASKNRWICVQVSSFGSEKSSDQANYAYFVSFDMNAMGDDAENLPDKDLAAQMLYHISYLYQNALRTINEPNTFAQKRLAHIEKHAEVKILDLIAMRDTLHKTSAHGVQSISNQFSSVIYYDKQQKDYCVLRLIVDNTVENKGFRDFAWRFWNCYTADPKCPMLLYDLDRKEKITAYAEDKWVYLPWHNPETDKQVPSSGKRKPETADELRGGVLWNSYTYGFTIYNHQMPTNMYNEPLYLIAVKRVKDTGKPSQAFEDGTAFEPVSLVSDALSEFQKTFEDVENPENIYLTYGDYLQAGNITLNGSPYDFKFTNKP